MRKAKPEIKRFNRRAGLDEAINKALDPALKKRGFASRDLIAHWKSIAPVPYGDVSVPDKLHWPRGEAGAEGAILFLRCADSHRLALAHEGQMIAAAVNRYFGYILVGAVKLSAAPFIAHSDKRSDTPREAGPEVRQKVNAALTGIEDDGLKAALRTLGLGLMSKDG